MLRLTTLLALLFFNAIGRESCSQSPPASNQQSSPAAQASQPEPGIATFRITTREVVVDVIALHGRSQPVLDLTTADLQVSEAFAGFALDPKHGRSKSDASPEPGKITALHIIDPNAPLQSVSDARDGFQISASCLERSTQYYRLAFRPGPGGWRSGYHSVAITTTRPGVKLYYRHQYYVGLTEPAAQPPLLKSDTTDKVLLQAAYYYPETPPSILLRARFVDSGRANVLRYSVAVDADSLSFLTLGSGAPSSDVGIDRHVNLDYGVCNFDTRGSPINFFHAPLEKVLTSADYARALDRGFPHVLEFPAPPHIAVTRVVVRDRATGNLGAVDTAFPNPEQSSVLKAELPATQTAADLRAIEGWQKLDWASDNLYRANQKHPLLWPPPGPIGSFGSIVPAPHFFCGDVYELPVQTPSLPDFRELDPIGSIYTSALAVPAQIFSSTSGIPGMTPRTNLFGIDYHGAFWIERPGNYKFLMLSDDGAILRIDDKKIIDLDGLHSADAASGKVDLDAGRHTIEVQYYQGAVNSVALELWVKPPGATSWTLFDLHDHPPPVQESP